MTTRFRLKTRSKILSRAVTAVLPLIIAFFVTSCTSQGVTMHYEDDADVDNVIEGSEDRDEGAKRVDITMEGGSGKAYIESPVEISERDGVTYAKLVWNSENYDYVIVYGEKYLNENPGGQSTFTVPVKSLDEPFEFIGDTVAMSKPHEIEYTITWGAVTDKGDFKQEGASDAGKDDKTQNSAFGRRPEEPRDFLVDGQRPSGKISLSYAEGFDIIKYGDYRLISIYGADDFLLVPEGGRIPEISDEKTGEIVDITVLQQPLDNTYLVSTSVMDLVRQIGALDYIRLSGTKAEDWSVKEAIDLMQVGKIVYAGKYRTPDYELILSEGCDFAIENTMIYHDPEVKEKLEELGIPVMVETSSYEKDPRGRLEWIKLYGALYGKETEAEDYYSKSEKEITSVMEKNKTDKQVAFFSVTASGMINVRKPDDYIAGLIELAGGNYVPAAAGTVETGGSGTMNMQMEDFYAATYDADILIYNSTIRGELGSFADLVGKNGLFSEYKAVKEQNVYCMTGDFFQHPTDTAEYLSELRCLIEGQDGNYTYFEKLK